jgi:hypothetical protein
MYEMESEKKWVSLATRITRVNEESKYNCGGIQFCLIYVAMQNVIDSSCH